MENKFILLQPEDKLNPFYFSFLQIETKAQKLERGLKVTWGSTNHCKTIKSDYCQVLAFGK